MDLDTSILIVDDDDGIRGLISDFLQKHGYRTDTAADAPMMRHAAQQRYDLIVLDVMMPREDGLTALRQLGSDAPPVIMLSAVGSDIDRIVGLEMGADDYLAKPCNPRELLARIRTVLRREARALRHRPDDGIGGRARGAGPAGAAFRRLAAGHRHASADRSRRAGDHPDRWRIPPDARFAEHPRRVLTRDQLLDWSRGEDSDQFDWRHRRAAKRLRRKLSMGEGGQDVIRTIRNEGYLFQPVVTQRRIGLAPRRRGDPVRGRRCRCPGRRYRRSGAAPFPSQHHHHIDHRCGIGQRIGPAQPQPRLQHHQCQLIERPLRAVGMDGGE
jgi:two-component system OmpR family response regulator